MLGCGLSFVDLIGFGREEELSLCAQWADQVQLRIVKPRNPRSQRERLALSPTFSESPAAYAHRS